MTYYGGSGWWGGLPARHLVGAGLRPARLLIVAAAVLLAAGHAWAQPPVLEPISELVPVEYVRTIDGDTIVVRLDGEELHVRLLGIDAPEPREGTPEAFFSAGNLALMLSRSAAVNLEYDAAAGEDSSGRELAWVWYIGCKDPEWDEPDGLYLANLEQVAAGYAELYPECKTERYRSALISAWAAAQE